MTAYVDFRKRILNSAVKRLISIGTKLRPDKPIFRSERSMTKLIWFLQSFDWQLHYLNDSSQSILASIGSMLVTRMIAVCEGKKAAVIIP